MLRILHGLLGSTLAAGFAMASSSIEPPGFRPKPFPKHALTGATVVPRPGQIISNAVVVIEDGRIASIGENSPVPPDARVRSYAGKFIYAGFIDPYWTPSNPKSIARSVSGGHGHTGHGMASGASRFHGVPGSEPDPGHPGPGHGSATVTPEVRMALRYIPDLAALKAMREMGFTAGNLIPTQGIIRGQSALVQFNHREPSQSILAPDRFQHVAFSTEASPSDAYPKSLMGVIAVFRQAFLDAQFTVDHPGAPLEPDGGVSFNPWLQALAPAVLRQQPVVLEAGSALLASRAAALASELNLESILVSSGQEWRRPDLLAASSPAWIVPLDFPEVAKLPSDEDWEDVSLDQLRTWDWAPENPAVLQRAGKTLSFTVHGLGERKSFLKNLRLAVQRGLSADEALAGLTIHPARILKVQDQLGTIEPGKWANLTVFENGAFLDEKSRVAEVWAGGESFPMPTQNEPPSATPTNNAPVPSTPNPRSTRTARSPQEDRGPTDPARPVWIREATVWTSSAAGKLSSSDLLVTEGKIKAVGPGIDPQAHGVSDPLVISGKDLHVTPGLIDAHSHGMILGAVNEATLPSTAMVRVEDVINSETVHLYLQLAGGVTTVNLLHGSANPIGGQNCVIKLRDGATPEATKFEGAPPGIKFALGENVKQSNWGDGKTNRFPQTRMGVITFLANRFAAAQAYRSSRSEGRPRRRDLELETLAEILQGQRWIHCHSYRQDEILAFLRLMESLGVRVGTLQHVLEGYKVADEIARHGAGASTFSDWWAFKFEVYDAIPFNGALLHQRGASVSFNSDSTDHARRLNTEAAKAVKYGGLQEEEALAFVTINPARQLRLDHRVGSLEAGKDADFTLWSASPLDATAVCLQTWIDGRKYFDQKDDASRHARRLAERSALLAKARKAAGSASAPPASSPDARKFFQKSLEHEFDGHDRHCLDEEEGHE